MTSETPVQITNEKLARVFSDVVGRFVSPGEDFALLDFPDHPNIGDSAIYAGEIAFFDQHVGRPASYVCSLETYRRDVAGFCPDGPLFLHGGGNFGSVWKKHQLFRHDVIETYQDRRIIQMAQSIHYDPADPGILEDSKRLIGGHPDFTLLVRDKPSYDLATAEFDCPVFMCPDAAHCLLELPARANPRHGVMSLLRDDKETAGNGYTAYLSSLGPIIDWGRQPFARSPMDRLIEKAIAPRLPASRLLMRRREKMYRRQAMYRVQYGARLLSGGGLIVSDRLHAHLISELMGKKHICLDNSYGKIARYIAAWGARDITRQVTDREALKGALQA